jgi:hypothetical protein
MFSEKWQTYIDLWFTQNVPFYFDDLIPKDKILLWGIVPYSLYMKSVFYNYNPIQLNNTNLNIYFYVRKLNESDLYLYFFANTTVFKSNIINSESKNVDVLFLKRMYEHSISLYQLFNHAYSENCWETLNDQKHLFIE